MEGDVLPSFLVSPLTKVTQGLYLERLDHQEGHPLRVLLKNNLSDN